MLCVGRLAVAEIAWSIGRLVSGCGTFSQAVRHLLLASCLPGLIPVQTRNVQRILKANSLEAAYLKRDAEEVPSLFGLILVSSACASSPTPVTG